MDPFLTHFVLHGKWIVWGFATTIHKKFEPTMTHPTFELRKLQDTNCFSCILLKNPKKSGNALKEQNITFLMSND